MAQPKTRAKTKRVGKLTRTGTRRAPKMTRAEARAFVRRWRLVNEMERQELRATPPAVKFRQMAELMALGKQLGWDKALAEGDDEVRERWNRLRKAYGV